MSSEEIKKIIFEYLGKPNYYLGSYDSTVELIKSVAPELTENSLRNALDSCKFKTPDYVGLIALVCPILVLEVGEIGWSRKWMRTGYRYLTIMWYMLLVVRVISTPMTRPEILMFGVLLLLNSISYKYLTKHWNSLELLYSVSKKVP